METDARFLLEPNTVFRSDIGPERLPSSRRAILSSDKTAAGSWGALCTLLGVAEPLQPFPVGAPRGLRLFRDDRPEEERRSTARRRRVCQLDDSPWILPPRCGWQSRPPTNRPMPPPGERLVSMGMRTVTSSFLGLVGTFPGNMASFAQDGLVQDEDGAHLVISRVAAGGRPYRSGALASVSVFEHGRFEAEIRAARGSGLVTGFFLHRDAPRQEVDVELLGHDPQRMLVNVYFNPGDEGAAMDFGYRGSPYHVDLGFDATLDFHLYTIDWRPGVIVWSVDGEIVHERLGWDPTPLPHLPMHLHANLWAPRSGEVAGPIDDAALPATATFRNISVRA
jgi:hypothetical protein